MDLPTLEAYQEALNRHDWSYDFSDDHRVWQAGVAAEAKLVQQAKDGGPEYKKAYNTAFAAMWHREPFSPPYKFPFPEVLS